MTAVPKTKKPKIGKFEYMRKLTTSLGILKSHKGHLSEKHIFDS